MKAGRDGFLELVFIMKWANKDKDNIFYCINIRCNNMSFSDSTYNMRLRSITLENTSSK